MSTFVKVAEDNLLSKPLDRITVAEFWQTAEPFFKTFLGSYSPPIVKETKKRFLTKKEACVELGNISLVTIDKLTKAGLITAYRPTPDRVVYDSQELEQYVLSTNKKAA